MCEITSQLDVIANKEDGEVVSYHVIVTFSRIEFGGKATRVANGFWRSLGVNFCAKANENICLGSTFGKELGGGK